MNKLYERIDFENGTTPALNDTNLNAMSKAIDDIDDRVIEVSGSVTEVIPEIQELLEDAQGLKDDCETYATNASTSESNARTYAQQAAAGSGGNALEYASNILKLKRDNTVLSEVTIAGGGGGGGVSDYTQLTNKPSINNVTLTGNKTAEDLGLADAANVYGSDAYNASTTYAIGSCCIYENALYKAIQDNVVGVVPTNSSYWEKVSLESLEKGKCGQFELISVKYTNASAVTIATNKTAEIQLAPASEVGDIFMGIGGFYVGNSSALPYSIWSTTIAIKNTSSSSITINANTINIQGRWLKWL